MNIYARTHTRARACVYFKKYRYENKQFIFHLYLYFKNRTDFISTLEVFFRNNTQIEL